MADKAAADKFHLGFLRVISLDAGYVGGLLVTNRIGRPLEFQCTTPVRPNRTQEVLYGTTLESFLYCEVLAKTLIERMAVKPDVVLVDQAELLPLRTLFDIPVVQLVASHSKNGTCDLEMAVVHEEFAADRAAVERLKKTIPATADLLEPLERVKDALTEALRSAA